MYPGDHAEWDDLYGRFNPLVRAHGRSSSSTSRPGADLVWHGRAALRVRRATAIELLSWARKKGPDGLRQYRQEKNRTSIDGLPTGLPEDL